MIVIVILLIASISCQPTPVLTDNCLEVVSGGNACGKCANGFYLQYFICLPCAPLCTCTSQYNYCESCYSLPYKNTNYTMQSIYQASNNRCVLCYSQIPGCLSCSNITVCNQCSAGSYLIGHEKGVYCSAEQCMPNCQICSDSDNCQLCQDGYYLDTTDNSCSTEQCTSNCSVCADLKHCSICQSGHELDITTGLCKACPDHCLVCSQGQCEQCDVGWDVDTAGTGCDTANLPSDCLFSYQGACQVCQTGYFVRFGTCYPCVGCQQCSLQFLCQTPCINNSQPFNYACLEPFSFVQGWEGFLGLSLSLLVALLAM